MSWTKKAALYEAFTDMAMNTPITVALPQWILHVWEVTEGK